jgi:dTDP-4-amino-4,6-dideoxygalactose transaminase
MGMIKLPKKSIDFFNDNYPNIFETGNLAEGDWNKKVAEWSCNYTVSQHALAVNSNGAGMFALLRILKQYRAKKRIFLQSNTMYGVRTIAISSGLELCGYVDCSLDYLMPTYEQVENFFSYLDNPSECVFLLTHIGGWVNPDIEKIAKLCKNKGVALLEDCAHSLGSTLKGKHTGTFGDAGVYSLYATKAIPVGEGGIIVTKDKELYQMVEKFVMYDRFDQKLDIGVNLRMSEINALLTYAVIQETESIIKNKYKIAQEYIKACDENNWKYIVPISENQRSNLYKFILLSNSKDPKKEFFQIKSRTSTVYDYALGRDPYELTERHICLPIWYLLEDEIVEKVISELNSQ